MDTFFQIYNHTATSYHVAQAQVAEREARGVQPEYPFVTHSFLFWANVGYLGFTFCLYKYMNTRERFECGAFKGILLVYNAICVALAAYVVIGICSVLLNENIPRKFVCNDVVVSGSEEDIEGHSNAMAKYFWVFYIQKFWEFMDTWFFILRKSYRQVTFLHIFHHASITIVVGLIYPFEYTGDMYLPILLNAGVHVLMYSHYLVAALGLPTPWRPWLTSIQLTQFVLIAVQSSISMFRGDSCGAPYFGKLFMVVYMGSMLVLFANFFLHAYVWKKDSARFGGGVVKRVDPIKITRTHQGRVELDAKGCAVVELPKNLANFIDINYTVMPLGKPMPNLHVCREPEPERSMFELAGGVAGCSVSYTVTITTTILGKPAKQKPMFPCCNKPLTVDMDECGKTVASEGDKKLN